LMVFRLMVRNLKNRPDTHRGSIPASDTWSIIHKAPIVWSHVGDYWPCLPRARYCV
jgi:hypothetical protein